MTLKNPDLSGAHFPARLQTSHGERRKTRGERQQPSRLLLSAAAVVVTACAALLHADAPPAPDMTFPVITFIDSPPVTALFMTAAKVLAESEMPVVLMLPASQDAYPDTRDVPLRARLLTPTRFVLERLMSATPATDARVILGRLHVPDNAGESAPSPLTLRSLTEGRLPSAVIRPETLLLTTAGWRLADRQEIYRQLLAALDQAVAIENAARQGSPDLRPENGFDAGSGMQTSRYRLSLDWSLVTALQLRIAWVREVHPELADRNANILSWIASGPLAEVSPSSVDPVLRANGGNVP